MVHQVRVTRDDLGNQEFDKILFALGVPIADFSSYTAITMLVSQVFAEFQL